MELRSDGESEAEGVALMERLSDHPKGSIFSNFNRRLQILDDLFSEISYSFNLIKKYWGAKELVMMAFFVSGFILGTWDIGIGEISSGGDYDRWGIMGDESGFLHMKDLALIVSLLSLICWLGFVVMLWNSYPIMRENMLYLLIGMGFILFGFIRAHAENPDFPTEAGLKSWTWVIIANLIMLFLSTFVVRRAVVETRDIHVQRKHVPRTLKRLENRDELISGQRHVPGAKQRRRVYGLTASGRARAGELRDRILNELVFKNGEKIVLGTLRKGGQMTLDLLSYLDEGLVFHESRVISPVSNPEGTASLDAQAGESLVKRMFARAWEDGKITKDEQQLITEVVTFLGMHPERVGRLSDDARPVSYTHLTLPTKA